MVNFYYHDLKNEVQILKKKHEFEQTWNWLKFDTGLICIWVGPNEKCVKSWKTLKSQSFIVVPFTPKINSYWLHIYIYIYSASNIWNNGAINKMSKNQKLLVDQCWNY
jgi:hypothetical protein